MAKNIILSKDEVNLDWINYVILESEAVSKLNDFEIVNYSDRELFNPEMQEVLNGIPDDGSEEKTALPLLFSFHENVAAQKLGLFRQKFRKLKEDIRKIICQILNGFGTDLPSWEDIIKAILLAVAGAFFGGTLGAVILPIIVTFVAKIIKGGINSVCPV